MPAQLTENYLRQLFEKQLHISAGLIEIKSIGGGSINDTSKVTVNGNRHFFLKLNSASRLPGLFEKEKNGLEFLRRTYAMTIPEVIICMEAGDQQLLLLEWIDAGHTTKQFWKNFGKQLAQLHLSTNDYFGFPEDNYMGALPQSNTFKKNWVDFFVQHRLQPQVKMAIDKQHLHGNKVSGFESLYKKLDTIFNSEPPSLLHGDLWSGNFLCDKKETPALIDPAVYFGHRSMDLAMTTLFGGFDKAFYEAYQYHTPLPANYSDQWEICNLYPLLVHLNIFGISYLRDIELILKKFSG
jgi:protein-ribulosamine 3-kinase